MQSPVEERSSTRTAQTSRHLLCQSPQDHADHSRHSVIFWDDLGAIVGLSHHAIDGNDHATCRVPHSGRPESRRNPSLSCPMTVRMGKKRPTGTTATSTRRESWSNVEEPLLRPSRRRYGVSRRARAPSRERPRPGKAWTAPKVPGLAADSRHCAPLSSFFDTAVLGRHRFSASRSMPVSSCGMTERRVDRGALSPGCRVTAVSCHRRLCSPMQQPQPQSCRPPESVEEPGGNGLMVDSCRFARCEPPGRL
ncbi:MAG: hypothetical protein QOJ62_2797 [Actinomycetota bacterium]|nr:hypothetical protein [Actinomycetota bacterium]